MTAPTRLLVLAIGLMLLSAPAAHAATSSTYDSGSKLLTLANDGTDESFAIVLDTSVSPATYKVTATNAALTVPAGSNCASGDAGKSLTCTTTDVSDLDVNGAGGKDSFTLSGTPYYYSSPGVRLDGGAGDDTFTATDTSALSSYVVGGEGNDTFNGSNARSDSFYAEPGNDTYHGGTAAVPAGADAETYQVQSHNDSYSAAIAIAYRRSNRRADPAPVSISLDNAANDIDGLGGTDNVADDLEEIDGTEAGDTLSAGPFPVTFFGGDGGDTLTGSPLGDSLYGGRGNDTIRGNGGADYLTDGDLDSIQRLSSDTPEPVGNDTLDGGDGDDTLAVGAGADDVHGGAGADTLYETRLETQVFDTYPDDEIIPKWLSLSISLDDQANDGAPGEGDNDHSDIENVDTAGTNNGLQSRDRRSTRGAVAYGTARGNDTITGTSGANVIRTGAGNDAVTPGDGADQVDVGDGDDQVNAVDRFTDVVACGRGTDNVGADLAGTNAPRADVLTDCENVSGTPLGLEGGVLPTLPTVPKLTLGGGTKYKVRKFLRTYTVTTTVTTDQAASASGELTAKGAKIAKVGALGIGSGKLKSGTGTRKLKVKVAVKYRKALKRKLRTKKQRKKGIKLALVVTVKNASGQTKASTRTIRVKG